MTGISKPRIKVGEKPALKYAAYVADVWAKEGDKALRIVAQAQHELGMKYARKQIKSSGIKGRDARAAGAVYEKLLRGLSVEHSIIEDTNKHFVMHTKDCPFLEVWKVAGADAPKLCAGFGSSFVQGLCKGVNPKLKYSVSRMMSKGNSYCEERIELVS